MKNIVTLIAVTLFAIGANAQDGKAAKKESCCSKKATTEKKMSAAEVEKCKAKCKAEGKSCATTASKKEKKSCCAKA